MLFSASTTLAVALGLGLTAASPIVGARAGGPAIIDGKAFQLAARGELGPLDPDNAASNAWVLGLQRISQGVYASVVIPRSRNKTENPTFYFNRTEPDGQQTLNIDIPGVYPLVATIGGRDQGTSSEQPSEHMVSFSPGGSGGTPGLYWFYRSPESIPLLGGGPARDGSWAVCRRSLPLPSGPAEFLQPFYIYEDETTPSGCVSVDWVVLCADMIPLKPGDGWNHDKAGDVKCVAQ
ncbi:hypothetical protein MAPG_05332 [Magnaporthiopsis poae ATCC 64411]|uniref:DUF7907 domain-containing protein n=1 Tax=Magnaporthiopsis poae (strain ATCC 64411 / 73-15) TaxID=644358 RepID=A0A0C4DZ43_MAGP6|nr:hypothetical protein MAPG_05332 [Magnaporthiopsis poae ATCC 64411]